jgi:predicted glycosyltransferase
VKQRVLFYVQHLLGIGHVKRAAILAEAMPPWLDLPVALGGRRASGISFGAARIVELPRPDRKRGFLDLARRSAGVDESGGGTAKRSA